MAETVDEIGAAIPLRRAARVRHERLAVQKQKFPSAERAADVERKRHVMAGRLAVHRRQRLQIGEEVPDILDLRVLVGGVGKRRKIMDARRRRALEYGGDEIAFAPSPDTVLRIRRDVRNVEDHPEWR